MTAAPRRRTVAAVFLGSALLFYATPVRQLSDSYYSLLVSQTLVSRGTLDLAPQFDGPLDPTRYPGVRRDGLPYQVKRYGAKVLYEFPLGAPLLATPWMAVANALGAGVVRDDGRYDRELERRQQRYLAALFSALFVAGVFVAASRALPRRAALWTTAAVAFATPVWSTASRGYWSHTAALALLGPALALVVARERGESGGGLRLGLLTAGAYVCRPTLSIFVALVGGDLLLRDRRAATRFALGALAVLAGLALVSERTWGTLLPPYYLATRLAPPRLDRLAGVLVSPSRGLLVFEPALGLLLVYAARRWRDLELRRVAALATVALGAHVLIVASFPHWWGGHGYGPRLFTETVAYQALVAIAVVATLLRFGRADRVWRRALVALVVVGVGLQAGGAISRQGNLWDSQPLEVDLHPERLWDWSDPQWLAWLRTAPPDRVVEPAALGRKSTRHQRHHRSTARRPRHEEGTR